MSCLFFLLLLVAGCFITSRCRSPSHKVGKRSVLFLFCIEKQHLIMSTPHTVNGIFSYYSNQQFQLSTLNGADTRTNHGCCCFVNLCQHLLLISCFGVKQLFICFMRSFSIYLLWWQNSVLNCVSCIICRIKTDSSMSLSSNFWFNG